MFKRLLKIVFGRCEQGRKIMTSIKLQQPSASADTDTVLLLRPNTMDTHSLTSYKEFLKEGFNESQAELLVEQLTIFRLKFEHNHTLKKLTAEVEKLTIEVGEVRKDYRTLLKHLIIVLIGLLTMFFGRMPSKPIVADSSSDELNGPF